MYEHVFAKFRKSKLLEFFGDCIICVLLDVRYSYDRSTSDQRNLNNRSDDIKYRLPHIKKSGPQLNAYFQENDDLNHDLNNREIGSTTMHDSFQGRKPHFQISKNVQKLHSLMGSRQKKEWDIADQSEFVFSIFNSIF